MSGGSEDAQQLIWNLRMTLQRRVIKTPSAFSSSTSSSRFLLCSMASLLSLSLLSFLVFISLSSAAHQHHRKHAHHKPKLHPTEALPGIQNACRATRFPAQCEAALAGLGSGATAVDILLKAIAVSTENHNNGRAMVERILANAHGDVNITLACNNCLESLDKSALRAAAAVDALQNGGQIKDVRAWFSAALAYRYDCWSGLKYANKTQEIAQTMAFYNDTLIVSSSNALSIAFSLDNFGNDTTTWGPPKTERDGFWEKLAPALHGKQMGFTGGIPKNLKVDAVVSANSGDRGVFTKVQDAINAAPAYSKKPYVIYIKQGVYQETVKVPFNKTYLVLLGDGMGKTVITGNLNVGTMSNLSTVNTATVRVSGDYFCAANITFENKGGAEAHQAVAFLSDSDFSIMESCEFLGNQDTLYVHSLRQIYKSCRIQGNVDFIFGNAAAIFQDCTILVTPRIKNPAKGESNTVTAHGRTDSAMTTGFVFNNCLINGTDDYMTLFHENPKVHKTFLGRPWKQFSRTVYINCYLEALIRPEGWLAWDGNFALDTLYYGEYKNLGPGANSSARVSWSSQIPDEHVAQYLPQNFVQWNYWPQASY